MTTFHKIRLHGPWLVHAFFVDQSEPRQEQRIRVPFTGLANVLDYSLADVEKVRLTRKFNWPNPIVNGDEIHLSITSNLGWDQVVLNDAALDLTFDLAEPRSVGEMSENATKHIRLQNELVMWLPANEVKREGMTLSEVCLKIRE